MWGHCFLVFRDDRQNNEFRYEQKQINNILPITTIKEYLNLHIFYEVFE